MKNEAVSGSCARFAFGLRSVVVGLLAGSVSAGSSAAPAVAGEMPGFASPLSFDIPAQPLDSALTELADRSGLRLLYRADAARQPRSRKLAGHYTPQQALDVLLHDTGLSYRLTDDGVLTIEKPRTGPDTESLSAPPGESVLAEAEPAEKPLDDGPVEEPPVEELDSIVVTETLSRSRYLAPSARTASRSDRPVMETPLSVQVVPRSVMDDQKVTRIKDALENVSGVRAQPSLGAGVGFIIRGFRTNTIYRNGVLTSEGFFGDFDAANLENIEVLKGPAQLYGRTEPGGMISITTKKPLADPGYSVEQQFGSFNLYRTQWDAGGPIVDGGSLSYRFSGAYHDTDSFRDFVSVDRKIFNPIITWRPTAATDISFEVEGGERFAAADFGIPAIGSRPANIPISRNLGDPNTPMGTQSNIKIGTEINHRFNDRWAVHNRFLASFADGETTFVNPAPAFNHARAFNQATGLLRRNIFSQESAQEHYALNLDLTGKFSVTDTEHDVLVGFDFYRTLNRYGVNGIWRTADPRLTIDIFNPSPSYGIPPATFAAARLASELMGPVGNRGNRAVIYNAWYGVYFRDQVTLWDRLHIIGGGRYDWAETGRGNASSFSEAHARMSRLIREDQGFSPMAGVLYQIRDELSLYGSWTNSFGANNAPAEDGRTFDPQVGEQFEAGIKTQLFDRRLVGTFAYYYLTKDNILVRDFNSPDPFARIANMQRSRGVELDVSGQVTDRVSVIASYAYTDTRILRDHVGGTEGNRMNNVPLHSASWWLRYDLNGYDASDGWSVGLGGIAAGQREGNNENTFQLPGFVRVDAFVACKQKIGRSRVTTQLNVRNLLDKEYFESTDPESNVAPALGIYPGAPLMAIGSILLEY